MGLTERLERTWGSCIEGKRVASRDVTTDSLSGVTHFALPVFPSRLTDHGLPTPLLHTPLNIAFFHTVTVTI